MEGTFWFILAMVFWMLYEQKSSKLKKRERELKKINKEENKIMSIDMLKEYVGKECEIQIENEIFGAKGTVLSVDEDWIKIETKKNVRIVRTDNIVQIILNKQ